MIRINRRLRKRRGYSVYALPLALVAGLSIVGTAPAVALPGPSHADGRHRTTIDPTFARVAARLKARTRVAVVLPTRLPDLGQGGTRIYASLGDATPSGYEVVLGFTPTCGGGSACRLGVIGARSPQDPPEGRAVTLADGTAARFVAATCGANCSDSIVTWRDGATERYVGLKAGDEGATIALADAVAASRAPAR